MRDVNNIRSNNSCCDPGGLISDDLARSWRYAKLSIYHIECPSSSIFFFLPSICKIRPQRRRGIGRAGPFSR